MTKRVEAVICSKVTALSRFTKKCLLLQLLGEGYNYNERVWNQTQEKSFSHF